MVGRVPGRRCLGSPCAGALRPADVGLGRDVDSTGRRQGLYGINAVWKMQPHNELVASGRAFCLARLGAA